MSFPFRWEGIISWCGEDFLELRTNELLTMRHVSASMSTRCGDQIVLIFPYVVTHFFFFFLSLCCPVRSREDDGIYLSFCFGCLCSIESRSVCILLPSHIVFSIAFVSFFSRTRLVFHLKLDFRSAISNLDFLWCPGHVHFILEDDSVCLTRLDSCLKTAGRSVRTCDGFQGKDQDVYIWNSFCPKFEITYLKTTT